ncbi:MAG: hypothetical protein R2715_08175 [Ilumatobacteraceae bacterium]
MFDRVKTCDNHCEFCFIYPSAAEPAARPHSLKDDDYRLSFLYGNFTTWPVPRTRPGAGHHRRLSPLSISLHATSPALRAEMLKNQRGAVSLQWLRLLLDHGITVRPLVICPGLNDEALDDTLAGILDEYPDLASVACVPLGVSAFNREPRIAIYHTEARARATAHLSSPSIRSCSCGRSAGGWSLWLTSTTS